jgi:uncharacterized protein (DUF2235 family)
MSRRLVIFADGTGNAFTRQESNVWRLYCATDRSRGDQVARYIPGVGTSGFRPYALLDGATGIGVPSNVRELYRFLSWNWREGDEIFLFGFSRGAFTIRTLIGLIACEGLMPAEIDGRRVASDEMGRNAKAAWRAYRATSKSFSTSWTRRPHIHLVRTARDAMLGAWARLRGHASYDSVKAAALAQGRGAVPIRYVGLFDTVEAFGVPFDELRAAIDVAIWPMSFHNQTLSPRVMAARHALALDDDRRTFHPVRFEGANDAAGRVQEVWFAGAHSDVGGGYPDGELSLLPLVWVAEGAGEAGLRFDDNAIDDFADAASAIGPRHDPRRGSAMFYRYAPREIGAEPKWGGAPVIHHAVAERMVRGNDGYAPLTLPASARQLPPGVEGDARLPTPADPAMLESARDAIWWRQVLYYLQLAVAALLALLPLTAPWIAGTLDWLVGMVVGSGDGGTAPTGYAALDQGVSANLGSVERVLGGLVPSYAAGWVQAVIADPLVFGGLALLFWLLRRRDGVLRDAARDCARAAWFAAPGLAESVRGSRSMRLARRVRTSPAATAIARPVVKYGLPGAIVVVVGVAFLVAVSRTAVTYHAASAGAPFCTATKAVPLRDGQVMAGATALDARWLCWASGVALEKGRTYTLWLDEIHPFMDDTVMSGVGGFRVDSWWSVHTLGLPIRRWWSAEWLQPIARVGADGSAEWPLLSLDRIEVPLVARDAESREKRDRRLVARFVAPESGELFLYLNDAIYWVPTGWRNGVSKRLYNNNHGRAQVTIRKEALPRPDDQ